MFEHVTLLLSFIYVIALTHLLSGATGLILARPRSFLRTASAMDAVGPRHVASITRPRITVDV
jgi:hypothetical protein